ncbi:MAG TPA: hypothetical protein VM911_03255 [Pyrinomonadaceae bacterium]|jgi:hypothetical protein|nr:hypothetical protein [Pyrinomonadaceae bacterium]
MLKLKISAFIILLCVSTGSAQRNSPASQAELAEITERGRQLAAYDMAAWYSTDAVMALKPDESSVTRYVANKTDSGWTVAYGRLNEKRDRFLIVYEATQGATPKEFATKKYSPPKEDTGFYLLAAKAIETALADFKGADRPYNVAVLPTKANQMYVYVVPAQTKHGIFPLGGDVRYLISQDGSKIVEKRQMHKAILEFETSNNMEAGYHVAVLDDVPEDTDVFHVLSRTPSVPEWIATRKYVYVVERDGTIKYVGEAEKILGIKK